MQEEKFFDEDEELTEDDLNLKIVQPTVEWKEFDDNEAAISHIFSKKHIKSELVAVEEWEMIIEVRGLPAATRNLLLQKHMDKDGKPNLVNMYPDLVIASCYNPRNGARLFKPVHRQQLNEDGGDILDKLAMVASRLSGMDKDALDKARKN